MASAPRAGRPRDPDRSQAILRAAYDLALRKELPRITSAELAAAAGVSTATLYRRWSSKEAVVLDAYLAVVEARIEEAQGARKRPALARLRSQWLSSVRAFAGPEAFPMRSLLACTQQSTELHQVFLERLIQPRRCADRELVLRACEEGGLAAHLDPDEFLDALYGALYFRFLVRHGELSQAWGKRHFDQLLAGYGA